jgi:hypothetical protein
MGAMEMHRHMTNRDEVKAVMNCGEWCDLYAITARLGYHPQSRYFGHVSKILSELIDSGDVVTKSGNLKTPMYKRV